MDHEDVKGLAVRLAALVKGQHKTIGDAEWVLVGDLESNVYYEEADDTIRLAIFPSQDIDDTQEPIVEVSVPFHLEPEDALRHFVDGLKEADESGLLAHLRFEAGLKEE